MCVQGFDVDTPDTKDVPYISTIYSGPIPFQALPTAAAAPTVGAEFAEPGSVPLSSAEALLSAISLAATAPGRLVSLQLPVVVSAMATGGGVQVHTFVLHRPLVRTMVGVAKQDLCAQCASHTVESWVQPRPCIQGSGSDSVRRKGLVNPACISGPQV